MTRDKGLKATSSALVVTLLSGCMTWQPVELADTPPPADALSERVRVTRADSSSVVLEFATLRGDSISGMVEGGPPESIALSEVHRLEAWRLEPAYLFVPAFVAVLWLLTHFPLDEELPPAVTSDSPGQ